MFDLLIADTNLYLQRTTISHGISEQDDVRRLSKVTKTSHVQPPIT